MTERRDDARRGGGLVIKPHDATHATYVVPPVKGSGPAVIVLAGGSSSEGSARDLCDMLGEEGYLALTPLGIDAPDIAALAGWARSNTAHCGKVGLCAFGPAAGAAWHAALAAEVDCAVIHCDPARFADLPAADALPVPVTLHVPGAVDAETPAALDRIAAAGATVGSPGNCGIKTYAYPDAAAGFAQRECPGYDPHLEGLAYSRTVRAFKRTMGPHYDLEELWDFHLACEFRDKDAEAAMRTMVPEPYVNHIPTLTGGVGYETLKRFYRYHFVNQVPRDRRTIPISQTVGTDRIVDEKVFCFTHDCEIDWLLPGVPPTGRYVEIALVGIVTFRGDKLVNEHIYWDQASVLVQIGLLDPAGLPVAGRAQARKLLDKSRPSNELMTSWASSATLPLDG